MPRARVPEYVGKLDCGLGDYRSRSMATMATAPLIRRSVFFSATAPKMNPSVHPASTIHRTQPIMEMPSRSSYSVSVTPAANALPRTKPKPLLEFAGNAILVHPDAPLQATGRQRGWRVLRPDRPYKNKAGDLLCAARQALGLW